MLGDLDRAEEIEEESLQDYAERRKITLTNPSGRVTVIMTKQELLDRVQELEDENQELQDQLDAIADIVSPDQDGADDSDSEDDSDDDDDQD